MQRLPEYLVVLGHKLTINVTSSANISNTEELDGMFEPSSNTIYICETLSLEFQVSTLYHELLHAVLYFSGWSHVLGDKKEEGIVLALEHLYVPLITKLVKQFDITS